MVQRFNSITSAEVVKLYVEKEYLLIYGNHANGNHMYGNEGPAITPEQTDAFITFALIENPTQEQKQDFVNVASGIRGIDEVIQDIDFDTDDSQNTFSVIREEVEVFTGTIYQLIRWIESGPFAKKFKN